MLPEIGKLPDLGFFGRGGKNATDAVGTFAPCKPFAIVPKELAQGVRVTLIGFVHGKIVRLNDDDLGATGLFKFCKEPVVEPANFDDSHEAAMFSGFFAELVEKIVNIRMNGLDLAFLGHISLFIAKVDGQLVFVLVDTKVQHWKVSVG